MTHEESLLMKEYGITEHQKSVFTYGDYKYENLKDAVNYAKIERARAESASDTTGKV
ncbi:MAG: hypothetical protein ACU84Q_16850 [Gammaproteobacteria bacterium]